MYGLVIGKAILFFSNEGYLEKYLFLREQVIIFVYDTGFCQTEADDPQKAVLFFHPHWVSDQQRLALCGQLMGAAHFCSTMFSTPKIMTLQCGKFILKKFGRYILCVGSDQTLEEWILQERFNVTELLLQFFHNSFESVFKRVQHIQEDFSRKLTEVLGFYVPILQCVVCTFGNVILLRCPKKNSAAFLEAFQLLEACCNFKGALGGLVLCSNRVVATQLDPSITKILALASKFHLKSHAEEIITSFKLPAGVQIFKVYLGKDSYVSLQNAANFKWAVYNGLQKKILQKAGKIMKKKKDSGKIFTVQEEGDWNTESPANRTDRSANFIRLENFKGRVPKFEPENDASKEKSKNFVAANNLKICSTPTVEKTLIHDELVSICNVAKIEKTPASADTKMVPDIVQDAINSKKFRRKISSAAKRSYGDFFRGLSIDDLMIDFSQKTYPVPLKYYTFALSKTYRDICISMMDDRKARMPVRKKTFYTTIADPVNPVFRYDGFPVSKFLYNKHLEEHYRDFLAANLTIDSREELLKSKCLDCDIFKEKRDVSVENAENNLEVNSNESTRKVSSSSSENAAENPIFDKPKLTRANQKAFRRSLSLPLKPLNCDSTDNVTEDSAVKSKIIFSKTPTTPLTTKLGLLALEEQQFAVKPMPTPNLLHTQGAQAEANEKTDETVACNLFLFGHQNMTLMLILDEGSEKNQDLIQSLCDMSLAALKKVEHLKNKTSDNSPATVNSNNINNNNNNNNSSSSKNNFNHANNNSAYSFLSLDSLWGATQRSGTWGDEDLKIVGSLHNDLNRFSNVMEIIIRKEDSVIYGYSCGGTKIFYQQGGCSGPGLPTPADLMGLVTLKARRRLERDRDVVIL